MRKYVGETEEEAVASACQDLGIAPGELRYKLADESESLFDDSVEIICWDEDMVEDYVGTYVRRILTDMDFEVETAVFKQDGMIYCNIDTDNNSILIGKNGVILRTLNAIVKQAAATEFGEKIQLSLDINGYKENRFRKVAAMGRRLGKQVQRSKVDVKLDPMPADERKIMHQTIAKMSHLATESKGEGKNRYITIYYVD